MVKGSLIEALIKNENYKEGNVHQAIMDVAYILWQSKEGVSWSYKEMLDEITQRYGLLARLAVQLGNLNYQVENGGWVQYYDNGYGDGIGGFGDIHNPSSPLLKSLICTLQTLPLAETEVGSKIISLLEKVRFKVDRAEYIKERIECDYCEGMGCIPEDDDFETGCRECNGTGFVYEEVQNENYGMVVNTIELDRLSEEYYTLNSEWMSLLSGYFKEEIEKTRNNNPCNSCIVSGEAI